MERRQEQREERKNDNTHHGRERKRLQAPHAPSRFFVFRFCCIPILSFCSFFFCLFAMHIEEAGKALKSSIMSSIFFGALSNLRCFSSALFLG